MIHFNKLLTILLAVSALLISCSDEELLEKKTKVIEGVPVTVNLPFGTHETTKIETRATDISEDNDVNSLAVVVFWKRPDGTVKKEGETMFIDNPSGSTIKLNTKSGTNYIYAVANYKSSLFDLEDQLANVSTISDIQNLKIRLPENNLSVLDDYFLMSGSFVADDKTNLQEEGECLVDVNGQISAGHVDLKHVMASITFNIKKGESTAVSSFVADTWQVMNVPQSSYLMERQDNDCGGEKETDYFNSKVSSTFKKENEVYNFSFLVMENRKDIITDNSPASWDDRERMVNKAGSEKEFTYADSRSTYVVLKGTYKGKTSHEVEGDTGEKDVMAYTTYYIHLGDWRSSDYADFKVFRNNRYIYTVTILGVDKLLVEVSTDNEVWGSDGEMYLSSSNVTTFDAHYGTTVISFDKEEMKNLAIECGSEDEFVKKFVIIAATPKNSFVADATDIDWVTYRRNPNDENRKSFAKYRDSDNPDYDGKLLDADAFKRDLYHSVMPAEGKPDAYDLDGRIYYTCFIDEYFYYADEAKTIPAAYSTFINQSPRTIQISSNYLKNNEQSSESSINLATYVLTQKSIWTIYNLENAHEINAWGTESVMEGNRVSSTSSSKGKDNTDDLLQGRQNLLNYYNNTNFSYNWDGVVDYRTNEMEEAFNTSFYACMNRNRDLNGDGQIDGDEIRWYLPSLNQYMGYWMGIDVLPEEVRLYTGNQRLPDNANPYIFLSSSCRNDDKGWSAMIFWASAGSSTSSYNQAKDWGVYKKLPYRCVRNLKSIAGDINDFVVLGDPLSDKGYESNTYQSFTNRYLNPRAMRANVTLPLASNHTHLDEENRLPVKFQVTALSTSSFHWTDSSSQPCPSGWRLPNQREVSIIAFHRKDGSSEKDNLHTATKSGLYNGYELENRRAYYYLGNVSLQILTQVEAHYRCVKDGDK
ncbi:MAG: fimbrial protein [Parabacteroides gordonii]|nr:fimbrial protein [Parabacteroides gordonii]